MLDKTVPQCLIGGDGRTDADGHGGRRATKTGATAKCRVRSIGIYWTGTTHASTCLYFAEKKFLYLVGVMKLTVSLCATQNKQGSAERPTSHKILFCTRYLSGWW